MYSMDGTRVPLNVNSMCEDSEKPCCSLDNSRDFNQMTMALTCSTNSDNVVVSEMDSIGISKSSHRMAIRNGTHDSTQHNFHKITRSIRYHSNWAEDVLNTPPIRFWSTIIYLVMVCAFAVLLTSYYMYVWKPACILLPWKPEDFQKCRIGK